jgi:NADH-quinone oxidoreductase subunit M
MIYERTHSREIDRYSGLAKAAPWFTIGFFIITMSSIAVPITNGFIGEFLILLGAFKAQKIAAIAAVSGVVLGAAYMLWMVKRVFFGPESEMVKSCAAKGGLDLSAREFVVLAPFVVLVFVMGLAPNLFLGFSQASLDHLLQNRATYELQVKTETTKPDPVATAEKGER